MTPEEALALLIDCDLSKSQYETVRLRIKSRGCLVLPTYQRVPAAKKSCHPQGIVVTAHKAFAPIKAVSGHTTNERKKSNIVTLNDCIKARI